MSLPETDFRAVYDAHFEFVWRALRRLGVADADAMDLTQKVFVTAYFKLGDFQGRSRLSTWLFGICRHVASDHRRSALVRREVAIDAAELDSVALQRGQQVLMPDPGSAAAAQAILNKLPEPQRLVFLLFELEELSGEDIAALLDISVGTVRSRLRLARETLRREVKRVSMLEQTGRKEAV